MGRAPALFPIFPLAALILQYAQPLAMAHEHIDSSEHMTSHEFVADNSTNAEIIEPSYFTHPEYAGFMYAHIALMVLAWAFVLPAAVMLSIGRSRLSLLLQGAFHTLNTFGIFVAIIYNARTPDLYKHNIHHSASWVVSFVIVAWSLLSVVNLYSEHPASLSRQPLSREAMTEHHTLHGGESQSGQRWSHDSGQGTERNSDSLSGNSRTNSWQTERKYFDDDEDLAEDRTLLNPQKRTKSENNKIDRFLGRALSRTRFGRLSTGITVLHVILERFTAILAFFAITTGMVTYAGIFHNKAIFGGLAHFIKGGIFFWYGLLTLGRWIGCFSDFGWAWNVKPGKDIVGPWRARIPNAEFTESFVIFLYGASNVFLEHLSGWGKAWSAQDIEHVSITIMFFGGGLLGMLIESHRIRKLLSSGSLTYGNHHQASTSSAWSSSVWSVPKSYVHPLNPMPALVIMLLGIMMSSHHQHSAIAAQVHRQWGTLFVGFAIARVLTYVTFWIKPPRSYLPTRPPTEIVASFCLTAGGIVFMASNSDTVSAMERYGLDAMIVFTVVMGLTAMIMAWSVCLIAMKAWATRPSSFSALGALRGDAS